MNGQPTLAQLRRRRFELLDQAQAVGYWRQLLCARLDSLTGDDSALRECCDGVGPMHTPVRIPEVPLPEPLDPVRLQALWSYLCEGSPEEVLGYREALCESLRELALAGQALQTQVSVMTRTLVDCYRRDPSQIPLPEPGPTTSQAVCRIPSAPSSQARGPTPPAHDHRQPPA